MLKSFFDLHGSDGPCRGNEPRFKDDALAPVPGHEMGESRRERAPEVGEHDVDVARQRIVPQVEVGRDGQVAAAGCRRVRTAHGEHFDSPVESQLERVVGIADPVHAQDAQRVPVFGDMLDHRAVVLPCEEIPLQGSARADGIPDEPRRAGPRAVENDCYGRVRQRRIEFPPGFGAARHQLPQCGDTDPGERIFRVDDERDTVDGDLLRPGNEFPVPAVDQLLLGVREVAGQDGEPHAVVQQQLHGLRLVRLDGKDRSLAVQGFEDIGLFLDDIAEAIVGDDHGDAARGRIGPGDARISTTGAGHHDKT